MKFSGDIRLLSHMKEFDEPFESVAGLAPPPWRTSATPCGANASRRLHATSSPTALNPALTAGTQWLERTLDDSANRRISIPEAFLATDGILSLCINIISGGTVYPNVIRKHLMEELPFMATENSLMECVKRGGDRQILHEAIRRHAVAAGKAVKQDGADNDLLDRIAADPVFGLTRADIDAIIAAGHFTGLAPEQTRAYVAAVRAALAADPTRAAALATPDDTKVLVSAALPGQCRNFPFRRAILYTYVRRQNIMLTAIVGINWGDEGKGRMVDLLSSDYDIICRYQGGNNAGHTVVNDKGKFILNLLPSGILRETTVNVMGNGMVIDLEHLVGEVTHLREKGITITPDNLKISDKAIICMPYHKLQDIMEEDRLADRKFGSTRRAHFAPVYADKYMKKGLRMEDLLHPDTLRQKVYDIVEWKNITVTGDRARTGRSGGNARVAGSLRLRRRSLRDRCVRVPGAGDRGGQAHPVRGAARCPARH